MIDAGQSREPRPTRSRDEGPAQAVGDAAALDVDLHPCRRQHGMWVGTVSFDVGSEGVVKILLVPPVDMGGAADLEGDQR